MKKNMKKQLFFDDNGLFARNHAVRKYGKPQLIATYSDGVCSTDYCAGWVFRMDDGVYRMIYFGHGQNYKGFKAFLAESSDGVHFLPAQINKGASDEAGTYAHEITSLTGIDEIANIYENEHYTHPNERYLALVNYLSGELTISDVVYTSPDLIHWTCKEGCLWGGGTEPMACAFYNEKKKCHTVMQRPFWGIRCSGYKETSDWEHFTEYRQCLNVDTLDERLAEIYGVPSVQNCGGTYVALLHLYRGLESELNAKYKNGIIDSQLAYSYDGRYWRRSLREPFLTGTTGEYGANYPLLWTPCVRAWNDGNIYFYCSASEYEHGPAFRQPGKGMVLVMRLRADGFISLVAESADEPAVLATREKVWHGGELHVNLRAKRATMAVYCSSETENLGGNVLGISHPIEGCAHEDCVPFEGDSTDWVPRFKSGKTLDSLTGKTLVFELRWEDGEVWSLSGNYTDVFNTQAARYRKFGVLPS